MGSIVHVMPLSDGELVRAHELIARLSWELEGAQLAAGEEPGGLPGRPAQRRGGLPVRAARLQGRGARRRALGGLRARLANAQESKKLVKNQQARG